MILVKRQPDTTTQKVVATFLKRVKKSGLTGRVRKTLNWIKPKSKLLQKQKIHFDAFLMNKYLNVFTRYNFCYK